MGEDEELGLFEEDGRVFLGWERFLLEGVVEWLWARREDLPGMLVVVPTAQSGRRLREALAEYAVAAGVGGLLAPRVVTQESLWPKGEGVSGRGGELLAWMEVLESVGDWEEFEGLFPEAPGVGEERGWAMGLAQSLVELQRELLEGGMSLQGAGRLMQGSIDEARWDALGRLEARVVRILEEWGLVSRSVGVLRGRAVWPTGLAQIVVAGVPDLSVVAERVLKAAPVPVVTLVGAPEAQREAFDLWGRPQGNTWATAEIAVSGDGIHVCADEGHEAEVARACVAKRGSPAVALATADGTVTPELQREFHKGGWELYDPAGRRLGGGGLMNWLGHWREFLGSGEVRHLALLVSGAAAGRLFKGSRFRLSGKLAVVREKAMPQRLEDLGRLVGAEWLEQDNIRAAEAVKEVWATIQPLLEWRERFRSEGFCELLGEFLAVIGPKPGMDEEADELRAAGVEFLEECKSFSAVIDRRGAGFGFRLFHHVAGNRRRSGQAAETVLDILGWMELIYEDAPHVVVCGMNEGCVPERLGGEPWLNENVREFLGLETEIRREARDAWVLHSLAESRRESGWLDLICGRVSRTGDGKLPSRLLLRCRRDCLVDRVLQVYQSPQGTGAGVPWERDWQLVLEAWRPVERMSVTAFSAYLACPFRFYLQRALYMEHREVDRAEWNAREFGNVAHEVLERFGRDEEAREFAKAEAIGGWLSAELARVVEERHGKRVPLAVQLQAEALGQRLGYLAREQASQRAAGWKIMEVERPFEIELDGMTIRGMIDRIERHDEFGWRVSDYKTGGDDVRKAHVGLLRSNSVMPAHVAEEEALQVSLPVLRNGKLGKPAAHVWRNLQVPLYAWAWKEECGDLPEVGYFTVWKAASEVGYNPWLGFDEGIMRSALSCASMVIRKVRAQEFWPPAEKAKYDRDFEELAMRRPLAESFFREGEFTSQGGEGDRS